MISEEKLRELKTFYIKTLKLHSRVSFRQFDLRMQRNKHGSDEGYYLHEMGHMAVDPKFEQRKEYYGRPMPSHSTVFPYYPDENGARAWCRMVSKEYGFSIKSRDLMDEAWASSHSTLFWGYRINVLSGEDQLEMWGISLDRLVL